MLRIVVPFGLMATNDSLQDWTVLLCPIWPKAEDSLQRQQQRCVKGLRIHFTLSIRSGYFRKGIVDPDLDDNTRVALEYEFCHAPGVDV